MIISVHGGLGWGRVIERERERAKRVYMITLGIKRVKPLRTSVLVFVESEGYFDRVAYFIMYVEIHNIKYIVVFAIFFCRLL